MVRKILSENGISETEVTGTGAGGRITREDALRAADARRAARPPLRRRLHRPGTTTTPTTPGTTTTSPGTTDARRSRPTASASRLPGAPSRRPPTGRGSSRRPRPCRWLRSAPRATRSCRSRTCAGAPPSTWCDRRRRRPTRSSPTRWTSRPSSVCARHGVIGSRPRKASRSRTCPSSPEPRSKPCVTSPSSMRRSWRSHSWCMRRSTSASPSTCRTRV